MRKLKLQMQMTVDGFVAGPNGEQDWVWLAGPDESGLLKITELAGSCDTLLLGRKMTREFVDHWENIADHHPENLSHPLAKILVDMRKIVFSTTQTAIHGRNVEIQNGDLALSVQNLKNEAGKDIMVYGGADFVRSLISQDLIDEYFIIINPVAIGAGLSIFNERKAFKLESSMAFKNGKILNKYLPV